MLDDPTISMKDELDFRMKTLTDSSFEKVKVSLARGEITAGDPSNQQMVKTLLQRARSNPALFHSEVVKEIIPVAIDGRTVDTVQYCWKAGIEDADGNPYGGLVLLLACNVFAIFDTSQGETQVQILRRPNLPGRNHGADGKDYAEEIGEIWKKLRVSWPSSPKPASRD